MNSCVARTFARAAFAPSRSAAGRALTTSSLRWSARPNVPDPAASDQGATGSSQKSVNAAGPSGTVPDAKLSDPYPLPFSPDIVDINSADSGPETGPESKWAGMNLASDRQNVDNVDAPMRVPGRETEDRDTKVARLVYQCRKRGTLETDLLLATFAKQELKSLPTAELDEFDRVSFRSVCRCSKPFTHDIWGDSCWTSQTGTSFTGAHNANLCQNAGMNHSRRKASWAGDCSSIPRMRKRSSGGCRIFSPCSTSFSIERFFNRSTWCESSEFIKESSVGCHCASYAVSPT